METLSSEVVAAAAAAGATVAQYVHGGGGCGGVDVRLLRSSDDGVASLATDVAS